MPIWTLRTTSVGPRRGWRRNTTKQMWQSSCVLAPRNKIIPTARFHFSGKIASQGRIMLYSFNYLLVFGLSDVGVSPLIVAWCYSTALWVFVSIGAGDGLVPVWHQAITWTNADFVSIGPRTSISMQFLSNIKFNSQNFICKFCLQNFGHYVLALAY